MTSFSPAKELCDLESKAVKASGETQPSDLSLDAEDVKERMVTGGAGLSLQPHQLQSRSNRELEFVSLPPSFWQDPRQSRLALPDSAPVPPAATPTAAMDIELRDGDMFYDGGPPSSAAFTPPEDGAAASPSSPLSATRGLPVLCSLLIVLSDSCHGNAL